MVSYLEKMARKGVQPVIFWFMNYGISVKYQREFGSVFTSFEKINYFGLFHSEISQYSYSCLFDGSTCGFTCANAFQNSLLYM